MTNDNRKKKIIALAPETLDTLKKVANTHGKSTKGFIEDVLTEYASVTTGQKKRIEYKRLIK